MKLASVQQCRARPRAIFSLNRRKQLQYNEKPGKDANTGQLLPTIGGIIRN